MDNWLFVLPTDSVQGSEQIVMNLAKYICKKGHKSNIVILTRKRKQGWVHLEKEMHITYLPFSSFGIGLLFFIPFLLFKNTGKTTYTFTSQTLINGLMGFSKKIGFFKNAKIILRESNSIFELMQGAKLKIYRFFYHLGYSGSSLVICQTFYMQNQLIQAIPKLAQKLNIHTIPNPLDFLDIKRKEREVLSELKNKNYIIAAGRLVPAKGFDILINSFEMVLKKYPELNLIILGDGKDKNTLVTQTKQLGLQNKISFPGYVKNVYPYFKEATVCVVSSRIEGFPNVLLQMMSQNNNVVSTLSAGGIESIPGVITCVTEDVHQLFEAIINAVENDSKKNKELFDNYLKGKTQSVFLKNIFQSLNA